MNGGLDEVRKIPHDAQVVACRQRALNLRDTLLGVVRDLHGVGARLAPDVEQDRARAVECRDGVGVGHAVFDLRDIGQLHGVRLIRFDDDVVELLDGLHASPRAERNRLRPLIHASAWNFGVLQVHRARDVGDGDVVGAQAIGVEPDVDLSLAPSDDEHLADAFEAFELPAEDLVRVLRDFPERPVRRQREADHGRRVRVELVDARLLNRLRQQRQRAVDLVTDFLRRRVAVLVEQEADGHKGHAFR